MTIGTAALTALLIVIAALLDLTFVRWLRRRRQPVQPRAPSEARAAPRPRIRPLRLLAAFLTPLPAEMGRRMILPSGPCATSSPARSLARYWRSEVLADRRRLARLAIALVGIGASVGIGLGYARAVMVQGWQLWAWIAAVSITCVALMPARWPALPRNLPWRWLGWLLVTGFLLRVTLLELVPGQLHPDEAGLALYAQLHVFPLPGMTVSPFVTGSAVQPTLHSYVLWLALATAGKSITALRLPSVIAGTLAILATYAAVAAVDSRRTALIAAAVMTTYHYHIHWSRLALNNIWDTLWVPFAVAMFAWGWKRKWSGGAVLAGLGLGLSQYFYAGSRVAIFLLGCLVLLLWRQDPDRRRLGVHLGKLTAATLCTAAPLGFFALFNPTVFFTRIPQVIGWYPEAVRQVTGSVSGWWAYFWHQFTHAFGAYLFYPEVTGFYGPGIAFTFGVAAVAFGLGALWAIRTRRWLPLAWVLLTAFLGGFIMRGAPSSSHYVVSIPGIVWLVAMPLDALMARGRVRLAIVLLAAIMISDFIFYFGVYVPRGAPDLTAPFPTAALAQPSPA